VDDLIISLENAPAIPGNKPNTIIKTNDLKSKTTPQEHATHFSTYFDIPLLVLASKSSDSSNKTMIEALFLYSKAIQ
jgi:hypothetical protein